MAVTIGVKNSHKRSPCSTEKLVTWKMVLCDPTTEGYISRHFVSGLFLFWRGRGGCVFSLVG